jgi:hypothetical protein
VVEVNPVLPTREQIDAWFAAIGRPAPDNLEHDHDHDHDHDRDHTKEKA